MISRKSTTHQKVLTILSFVITAGCTETGGNEDPFGEKSRHLARIKVVEARPEKVIPELESFGTISFVTKTDITPFVEGTVETLYVREGNRIEKGDLLAEIENLQLQIRSTIAETGIASAQAALALAEAKYWEGRLQVDARLLSLEMLERTIVQKEKELRQLEEEMKNKEKLFGVDGISEDQLKKVRLSYEAALTDYNNTLMEMEINRIGLRDQDIISRGYSPPLDNHRRTEILRQINNLTLKAEVEVARAQLISALSEKESIDLLLQELKVRSPGPGVVGSVYLEEGERLAAGTTLFTVFNDDEVYARFPVRERDMLYLKKGQEVRADLPAQNKTYIGTVDYISPTIDPQSGNVMIKAILKNPGKSLKPGMFTRVTVVYGEPEERIVLPVTCLTEKSEETGFLYTVVQGRAFQKTVALGQEKEGRIEIVSGIGEGELIIDSPSPALREGEEVDFES